MSNSFLHELMPDYNIDFSYEKDALMITLKDLKTECNSDITNLSGFEFGTSGLAVRNGISQFNAIYNNTPIQWIALDEVDAFFTEENSELLFKTIMKLKSSFKQILLITHKPLIKEIIEYDDIVNIENDGTNSYVVNSDKL